MQRHTKKILYFKGRQVFDRIFTEIKIINIIVLNTYVLT